MSFPLDLRAFGCTALLPSAATPYGCIFRTTARHERVPVRVLTRSVSDVGRSPVRTPWCILLPQAHQTRRAAVQHSPRPVAFGCGKLCCHSTALICRRARRAGVRELVPALFSPSRQHLSHRVRGGPTPPPCRGPFRAGRLPPPGGCCTLDERQRVLDGHCPACPSWTHQKRSFSWKLEASLDPTGAPASTASPTRPGLPPGAASWRGSRLLTFWTPTAREARKEAEFLPFRSMRGPYYPVRLFPLLSLRPPGGSVTLQAQPQLLHPAPTTPPLAPPVFPGLPRGAAGGCSRH